MEVYHSTTHKSFVLCGGPSPGAHSIDSITYIHHHKVLTVTNAWGRVHTGTTTEGDQDFISFLGPMYDELQAKFLDWLRLTYSMSCDSFACAYSQPNRCRGIKSARHKQARSCSKPIAQCDPHQQCDPHRQHDPHQHISHTSHPRPPGGNDHRAINAYTASTYATNLYPTIYVADVHNTTYVNGVLPTLDGGSGESTGVKGRRRWGSPCR